MNLKRAAFIQALTIVFMVISIGNVSAVPGMINYQGKVVVGGTAFSGEGNFKFALVDAMGTTTYWSSPTDPISIDVVDGIYNVVLGESPMDTISATIFSNDDIYLRVWFDDGTHGMQLLTPDQKITSVGFAIKAQDADTLQGYQPSEFSNSTHTHDFTAITGEATDPQIPDQHSHTSLNFTGGLITQNGTDIEYDNLSNGAHLFQDKIIGNPNVGALNEATDGKIVLDPGSSENFIKSANSGWTESKNLTLAGPAGIDLDTIFLQATYVKIVSALNFNQGARIWDTSDYLVFRDNDGSPRIWIGDDGVDGNTWFNLGKAGGQFIFRDESSNNIFRITDTGFTIGDDATLYRSAANTLRTPDDLVVDGGLTSGSFSTGNISAAALSISGTGNRNFQITSTNGGTPYIDLRDDSLIDYDGRIILDGNDLKILTRAGGSANNIFIKASGGSGKVYVGNGLLPDTTNTHYLGDNEKKWLWVYSQNYYCPRGDVAEKLLVHPDYQKEEDYDEVSSIKPGTVVVITPEGIVPCYKVNDTRLAGVISTEPAFKMASENVGDYVALAGSVPCRVKGPVQAGDILTTSAVEGCAEKATKPIIGAIVGKALKSLGDEVGTIDVWIGGF